MKTKTMLLALAASLPCVTAMAADQYVRASDIVPNLANVAAYPALLPARDANAPLYAYVETSNDNYTLSLDSGRGCKGAHYCSIGALVVSKDSAPDMQRDMSGKVITVNERLPHGQPAFFTPGHAMGDYWPAQIQWMRNGALYTLSWNGPFPDGEQQTLVKMAQSVASK